MSDHCFCPVTVSLPWAAKMTSLAANPLKPLLSSLLPTWHTCLLAGFAPSTSPIPGSTAGAHPPSGNQSDAEPALEATDFPWLLKGRGLF